MYSKQLSQVHAIAVDWHEDPMGELDAHDEDRGHCHLQNGSELKLPCTGCSQRM